MKSLLKRQTIAMLSNTTILERLDCELKAVGGIKFFGLIKVNDAIEFISFFLLIIGFLLILGIVIIIEGQGLKFVTLLFCGTLMVVLGHYKKTISTYKDSIMHDNELPAIIETLAIGVNAGKSLESTIRYIIENKKGVVRDLLAEAMLQVDGGEKIEKALLYVSAKSLTREFEQIVRLIMESKNSTAKLRDLLLEQAEEIQEEKINRKLEKAAQLETKLFFPIFVGYFIPLVVMAAFPVLANFKGFLNY